MSKKDSCSYIDCFPQMRLLCIGDMMLDIFAYGKTNRLSPEAPVPVLLFQKERRMLGGAGNVVVNLRSLECQTSVVGVVGDDADGASLRAYMEEQGVDTSLMLTLPNYPTTVKTRYVTGKNHLLRVDKETKLCLPQETLDDLLTRIEPQLPNMDLVLLSDYGKGLFDERFTPAVIALCRKYGCRVIIDPKRTDYGIYSGATLVKPNKKEFEEVTGMSFDPAEPDFKEKAVEAGRAVCRRYQVDNLLVTLSEYGMLYIPADETVKPRLIPTEAQDVFDVSGAGDTSLAVLGASMAAGAPIPTAIRIANAAAGIVVGKFGTASVQRTELLRRMAGQVRTKRLLTVEEAVEVAQALQAEGKLVGFTNGCFDILHPGHLQSFERSRELCDALFVGLNSDASIKRLKGPERPINNQDTRVAMLTALRSVDYVVVFDDDTALPLIEQLRPDVIAKEGYPLEKWPEGQAVVAYGGRAVELPRLEGFSTTSIIDKLSK